MNRKMRSTPICFGVFLYLLVSSALSQTRYTGVELNVGGFASTNRRPDAGPFLAGSHGYIVVAVNSSDFDTNPASSFLSKPDWLDLEFSYGKVGSEFTPSDELKSLFSPVYFVDQLTDARKSGNLFFAVSLPNDSQDTSYCVRAVIFPPPYGPLQRKAKLVECFRVVAPSSDADFNRVLASHTDLLSRMGEYESIVEFADSLDQNGKNVEGVMGTAIDAAKRLERYDHALYYLDKRHEVFGERRRGRMNDLPPFQVMPYESQEQADTRYQRQRQDLLDKIGGKSGK